MMWVVTRSEWPILVNLSRAASIGYQQIAKFDTRTRVIAAAWEQEFVLADCADGDEAKTLIDLIARALAEERSVLDLRGIDLARARASAVDGIM
ncbi:MAG: hypothetical protein ACRDJC_20180 [Thermomicrobiales bacterium]